MLPPARAGGTNRSTQGASHSHTVADSARTLPRAILLALTVVATLYIGVQTVAQGVATAAAIFGGRRLS